jgi:hypothetical protein
MQGVPSQKIPMVDAGSAAAFYVSTNDLLVVYDATNATEIAGAVVSNGWNKIEVFCDFISKHWNITLNGTEIATNLEFYANASAFSELIFDEGSTNSAFFDDIAVTAESAEQDDADSDGLPDAWEEQYFGSNAPDPDDPASNSTYTVRQAYIAGFDPTDPDAAFLITGISPLTSESILSWSMTTGRVYTIYWTSNLLSGFQTLESNFTGGAYTDDVHGAGSEGFYKIEVEIE